MNVSKATRTGFLESAKVEQVRVPRRYRWDGTRRVGIWLHGATGTYLPGPVEEWLFDRTGCVWLLGDVGGPTTWAGDAAMNAITDYFEYAKAALGIKQDKMLLWGGSMGGLNAIVYASKFPENVAAVGCAIPAVDPEYVRTVGAFPSHASAIETVYGAGQPVPADRQAMLVAQDTWPGVPLKAWYSSDDTITPAASVESMNGPNVELVDMGPQAHSYTAALYGNAGPLNFFREHAA